MKKPNILSIQQKLKHWYQEHKRPLPWRATQDPYKIWVSEVMLQQTQVKTVLHYYQAFLRQFPDIHALARADLQEVLKSWEGLGYYARARHLHQAAKIIVEHEQGNIPPEYGRFHKLPGVGDYIAAAVISIAFNQPYPVVDGNVKRVLARLFCLDAPVNQVSSLKSFHNLAMTLFDRDHAGEFNQAMMELGATVCRPVTPLCNECPIRDHCLAFKQGEIKKYPVRKKSKPVPEYHIAIGVICLNHHVLITRRSPEGLLGGLWEFPGGKVRPEESAEQACRREIKEEVNLEVEIIEFLTRVKHAYTHLKIVADVFRCRYIAGEVILKHPVDYRWITVAEIDRYPFPAANHKFIPLIKNTLFFCE